MAVMRKPALSISFTMSANLPSFKAWGLIMARVESFNLAVLPGAFFLLSRGKKNSNSRLADSIESEPWQAFFVASEKKTFSPLCCALPISFTF